MFTTMKEFSKEGIFSQTIAPSQLQSNFDDCAGKLVQPMVFVFITSDTNLKEFQETSRTRDLKRFAWFVIFKDTMSDVCRHPKGNILNLSYETQIIVMCQGDTHLWEWYAVRNETEKFDFGTWDPIHGVRATTTKPLFERRNLQGIQLKIPQV